MDVELVPARPADALVAVADRLDARAIVVGTHGGGALRRAVLGSTAHRVLDESARPETVVRAPADG